MQRIGVLGGSGTDCAARSKGRRKSAAQGFVPSKKTAEQDYLQQALEEADQKDADAPTPDGPPAPGEPEGA